MQKKLFRQYSVAVLAVEDATAATIIGPQDVFSMTGVLYEMSQGKEPTPYFNVQIVTENGKPVRCYNNLLITPHCSISECKPDVIIIPGILNLDATIKRNQQVIQWLQEQFARDCILLAICSGSILLSETGLLDGKVATTHWAMENQFRKRYPQVLLKPDELITEAKGLICSGGFNSYLNVSIYLIEKLLGSEVAVQCSKIFLSDFDRHSQAPYSIFNGLRDHGNEKIHRIQDILENQYGENIDFDTLARKHGMGRRTLERHFKKTTGETLLSYLQRVRVEQAKQRLESGTASFDEISYQVGYQDNSFFRKLFIKYTTLRPGEYRAGFSRVGQQGMAQLV